MARRLMYGKYMPMKPYPPTPPTRKGYGESFFSAAIRREPIASPETSPATKKILISPSLEARSTAAWPEVEIYFLTAGKKNKLVLLLEFRLILSNIMSFTAQQKQNSD